MSTHRGFWIAATDNRVFDGIVTRHLIGHGNIIAIHAYFKSDSYSFSDIVGRLKVLPPSPPVRVLFYYMGGSKATAVDTIGSVPTLDDMENQLGLLLKDKETGDTLVVSDGAREFIALDPRVPKARAWLSDRVRTIADLVGSDGVALDGAIRSPEFLDQIHDPDGLYPGDFDKMISCVAERTLTIFNNLSARSDQEELLKVAHGASIERFGLNDTISRPPSFAADLLPYIEAIGDPDHDDRTFLVFGRASRNETPYTTYDEDWRWQRYLYCAYLLAAEANTRWKQHAGFLTSPSGGRAGGLEVYSDALHNLGRALGTYTVEDGCYRRAFERGLVLIVPSESRRPTTVSIARPMFTPEGTAIVGDLSVAPGEGQLLLPRAPARPPALRREFAPKTDPLWRWSALRQESNVWHLRLDDIPDDADQCEHDLALDLVRYRTARGLATLWYRTTDPSARVETVVEVDDTKTTARFALVDGSIGLGRGDDPRRRQFRGMPLPGSQFSSLPVIGGGTTMTPDGKWHTLVMSFDMACARSGRFTFRRALFARLLGSLDIKRLRLDVGRLPPTPR
jgi:hypothetical protein